MPLNFEISENEKSPGNGEDSETTEAQENELKEEDFHTLNQHSDEEDCVEDFQEGPVEDNSTSAINETPFRGQVKRAPGRPKKILNQEDQENYFMRQQIILKPTKSP